MRAWFVGNTTLVDRSAGRVTPIAPPPTSEGTNVYSGFYQTQYNAGTGPGGYSPGIVTGSPADWFGPLNPQYPSAPPEVAGRRMDYPSGYNLNVGPRSYEPLGFFQLQAFADAYDVLRTVIETRKDQMVRLRWNIKPRENAFGKKLTRPDDPILTEIRDFFMMPDGEQFWDSWLRVILEDMFVIDAATLFCRRDRGGKLIGLDNVDGATIKRIIDDRGRTPIYPVPAYQQQLKGLPAVNYTTKDLIYRPRNMRARKVYGYSQVEQIVMTINIALRRQIFLLQYYTEGNMPEALIGAPENWSVKQIQEFQTWLDTTLSGETGARRRARIVPGGIGKTYIPTKEGALTGETDEWLTRVICFAFSITPTPFIRQVNRATAESQKEQALEEGLAPTQMWVKSVIDTIIMREWKRTDVEFGWEIPDDVNAKDQSDVLQGYVKTGIYSINQALDKLGEDPIPGGDVHMALLPTGWVLIEPTDQFTASGGAGGAARANDPNGSNAKSKDPVDITPGKDDPKKEPTGKELQPPPAPPKEVSKSAVVPFGKGLRKRSNSNHYSADVHRSEANLCRAKVQQEVEAVFRSTAKTVGDEVELALRQLGKASLFDGPISRQIANGVNISGLYAIASKIAQTLSDLAINAYNSILDAVGYIPDGAADQELVQQVTQRELELVSPTGDMSIIPTTIEQIENIIQEGIDNGLTASSISTRIANDVFNTSRAELIANAETSRANSFGVEAAAEFLTSQGAGVAKAWRTQGDGRVCESICAVNELDGEISLDQTFSSGDKITPGHPKCRCDIVLVVL